MARRQYSRGRFRKSLAVPSNARPAKVVGQVAPVAKAAPAPKPAPKVAPVEPAPKVAPVEPAPEPVLELTPEPEPTPVATPDQEPEMVEEAPLFTKDELHNMGWDKLREIADGLGVNARSRKGMVKKILSAIKAA